jgi:hypothetical protein
VTTTEIYPDVVDGMVEEKGGVPSWLLKTDAGDGRQEGTPAWVMFAGSRLGRTRKRSGGRWMSWPREGARRMILAALEAEVDDYSASFRDEVDENGKRLVVRNRHAGSGA